MADSGWAVKSHENGHSDFLGDILRMSDEDFADALSRLYSFGGGKSPPGTFKLALCCYMDDADISVEELAFRSKVSERTIGKMRNHEEYKR